MADDAEPSRQRLTTNLEKNMNTYTLNAAGQKYVTDFVAANGKDGLNASAFFSDAEDAANDAFDRDMTAIIEIGSQMSYDGRPHVLTLAQAWFDAAQIDA